MSTTHHPDHADSRDRADRNRRRIARGTLCALAVAGACLLGALASPATAAAEDTLGTQPDPAVTEYDNGDGSGSSSGSSSGSGAGTGSADVGSAIIEAFFDFLDRSLRD